MDVVSETIKAKTTWADKVLWTQGGPIGSGEKV